MILLFTQQLRTRFDVFRRDGRTAPHIRLRAVNFDEDMLKTGMELSSKMLLIDTIVLMHDRECVHFINVPKHVYISFCLSFALLSSCDDQICINYNLPIAAEKKKYKKSRKKFKFYHEMKFWNVQKKISPKILILNLN